MTVEMDRVGTERINRQKEPADRAGQPDRQPADRELKPGVRISILAEILHS